jgi:hypothetical protein
MTEAWTRAQERLLRDDGCSGQHVKSAVMSALEVTFAERTARFRSQNLRGGPGGPPLRVVNTATEGIVDFTSRRAIACPAVRNRVSSRRLSNRWFADAPVYVLFDGPSESTCLLGRWQEPYLKWPPELPRLPSALVLLDLLRSESLVDAVEKGGEDVCDLPTTRYALTIDCDRIDWPKPKRAPKAPLDRRRLACWTIDKAYNPRPSGVVRAEVWIAESGRLVRFSHGPHPVAHLTLGRMSWPTTELWDFGVPPRLQSWKTQPVIDPVTLAAFGS